MKKISTILLTIILGIITFILSPLLWPSSPDLVPPNNLLPFYIFISLIESLTFGFGIAFLIIAFPYLKKVPKEAKTRTYLAFISLIWLLVSWWPHDNFHRMNGMNMEGLIFIEYGFHLTLIIASIILSYYFIKTIKKK
jgi:hypothetical protein